MSYNSIRDNNLIKNMDRRNEYQFGIPGTNESLKDKTDWKNWVRMLWDEGGWDRHDIIEILHYNGLIKINFSEVSNFVDYLDKFAQRGVQQKWKYNKIKGKKMKKNKSQTEQLKDCYKIHNDNIENLIDNHYEGAFKMEGDWNLLFLENEIQLFEDEKLVYRTTGEKEGLLDDMRNGDIFSRPFYFKAYSNGTLKDLLKLIDKIGIDEFEEALEYEWVLRRKNEK